MASLGVTVHRDSGWFGGARWRYFDPAPLIEDSSVRSESTSLVNLEVGYHVSPRVKIAATLFNVFDAEDNDITYFYESQLSGYVESWEDIHFHPVAPRTLRVTATVGF